LPLFGINRNIARRSSIGGHYVGTREIDILKLWKKDTLIDSVSQGALSFVGETKLTKAPHGDGTSY